MTTDTLISKSERDSEGKFLPGISGNSAGRPKSGKNQITTLKQNLEIALRENVQAKDIQEIIYAMIALAKDGNVGAGKLILDKVLSNAKVEEDTDASDSKITIYVKNATYGAPEDSDKTIIDVTPTEDTKMSTGAKESNQSGPPSGEAAGPVKDYASPPRRTPAKSGGGSGASVDATMPASDGLGGKK